MVKFWATFGKIGQMFVTLEGLTFFDKNKFLVLLKPFCAPMFRYFINFFSTQLILAIIVSCNVVSPIRQKVKILHRGLKYHEFR